MSTFVTLDELSHHVGQDLRWDSNAALLLEAACQAVRDFLDQDIDYTEDDTTTILVETYPEVLRLPQHPIVDITEVSVDGDDPLDAADYEQDGRSGLRRVDACWTHGTRVAVTYSHGWATTPAAVTAEVERVPASIRLKALELAASALTFAQSGGGAVTSETLSQYSYTVGEDASSDGLVLTEEQGMSIANYKLVRVV